MVDVNDDFYSICLEDGTEVDEEEYFQTIESNTRMFITPTFDPHSDIDSSSEEEDECKQIIHWKENNLNVRIQWLNW